MFTVTWDNCYLQDFDYGQADIKYSANTGSAEECLEKVCNDF